LRNSANKQTNKQTNADENITSLLGLITSVEHFKREFMDATTYNNNDAKFHIATSVHATTNYQSGTIRSSSVVTKLVIVAGLSVPQSS